MESRVKEAWKGSDLSLDRYCGRRVNRGENRFRPQNKNINIGDTGNPRRNPNYSIGYVPPSPLSNRCAWKRRGSREYPQYNRRNCVLSSSTSRSFVSRKRERAKELRFPSSSSFEETLVLFNLTRVCLFFEMLRISPASIFSTAGRDINICGRIEYH